MTKAIKFLFAIVLMGTWITGDARAESTPVFLSFMNGGGSTDFSLSHINFDDDFVAAPLIV